MFNYRGDHLQKTPVESASVAQVALGEVAPVLAVTAEAESACFLMIIIVILMGTKIVTGIN